MRIPVYVQPPCAPQKTRLVGWADDKLTAEEVAKEVGVPDGCFYEGKIMRRTVSKGRKAALGERLDLDPGAYHWSLVANVTFKVRA
jgi:hypothetical protein